MKDTVRIVAAILIGFVVLWYVGAMFEFFPFLAGDIAVRAVGFTGLLLCAAVVGCTCWILSEMKKK